MSEEEAEKKRQDDYARWDEFVADAVSEYRKSDQFAEFKTEYAACEKQYNKEVRKQ